jgi:Flp pilus assembly protein TadG
MMMRNCGRRVRARNAAERNGHADWGEQGASLVEMAVSLSVFLSVWIGIFVIILAVYSYLFVSNAAREASRYAMVRGSQCSTNTPGVTNCGVTQAELQTWVQNLGYPGLNKNNLTVTANWLTATTSGSTTTWSACSGSGCNLPGNMVKVTVSYAFPFSIPFWQKSNLNIGSTSGMVISQ